VIDTVLRVVSTVLEKIRDVFVQIFNTIRDVVFGAFQKIKDIIVGALTEYFERFVNGLEKIKDVIVGAITEFVERFMRGLEKIKDLIVGALSEYFERFVNGLGKIKDVFVDTFNSMVDFFGGVVSTLARVGGNIFGFIKDSFRGALNFVINGWNSLRFTIPSFGVGPVKFPGFELGVPRLPLLANGAIVTGPMLAGIGEAGPEAVIPISRPARAMQLMEQSGLAAMVRGQGSAVTIQTANFVNGTDADLVAQKVMAAWRGRAAA
jgi:hypothetical protein